jgi:GTP cyclohydrolase II
MAKLRSQVQIHVAGRANEDVSKTHFCTFDGLSDDGEHFAILFPPIENEPLVRIHSECLTGDLFQSTRCDCGPQLDEARTTLSRDGGILIYLRQEGRGIGLYNKLAAYRLQDEGFDTFLANRKLGLPEDARDFSPAAEMLTVLNIRSCRLITNNPDKVRQLRQAGVTVKQIVNTKTYVTDHNRYYLETKKSKGHLLRL